MKKVKTSKSNKLKTDQQKPSFLSIVMSTFAAAFGVQNRKNLEQDFKHGNIKVYIIAGLIFTAIFVFLVILAVKLAINSIGIT